MIITRDTKFDMWDEQHGLREFVTNREHVDLNDIMEIIRPYWEVTTSVVEGTMYPLMQIHSMIIKKWVTHEHIGHIKSVIMNRLRDEEVERRGYKSQYELYLYWPHQLVFNEYPVQQDAFMSLIELDENVLKVNQRAAGKGDFSERDRYHIESMVSYMEWLRVGLIRRTLR